MKLFLWLLQIVAEMVRNLVMAYVSFVPELVGDISYGSRGVCHTLMFAMVVTCKKEHGRETIVDQWDVDISKAADAAVQT